MTFGERKDIWVDIKLCNGEKLRLPYTLWKHEPDELAIVRAVLAVGQVQEQTMGKVYTDLQRAKRDIDKAFENLEPLIEKALNGSQNEDKIIERKQAIVDIHDFMGYIDGRKTGLIMSLKCSGGMF